MAVGKLRGRGAARYRSVKGRKTCRRRYQRTVAEVVRGDGIAEEEHALAAQRLQRGAVAIDERGRTLCVCYGEGVQIPLIKYTFWI